MKTIETSEAKRLHSKDEPHMVGGTLYSMLDLMGAEVTCDTCGNWQRIPAITPQQASEEMTRLGWKENGEKHTCPACATRAQ